APTDRTVVVNNLVAITGAHAVEGFAALIADAQSEVTDDHVMSAEAAERVALKADAVTRCRLAGDGEVRVMNDDFGFELDHPAGAEHDGARALCLTGGTEAAGAVVVEV